MYWIHFLVGISTNFANYRKNQPVTIWELRINLLKSPILQWWGKLKSDPESVSGTGSPAKVNHFYSHPYHVWSASITVIASYYILLTERQAEWHTTEHITLQASVHVLCESVSLGFDLRSTTTIVLKLQWVTLSFASLKPSSDYNGWL